MLVGGGAIVSNCRPVSASVPARPLAPAPIDRLSTPHPQNRTSRSTVNRWQITMLDHQLAKRHEARERSAKPSFRSLLIITGLAMWAGAPLVGYVVLTNSAISAQLDAPVDVSVTALPVGSEISRPVALDISWFDTPPVVAPAWSGTVQTAPPPPDSILKSGDPVAQIDGVVRIAYASAVPFASTLQKGSTGFEVVQLTELLVFKGLLAAPRPTYDSLTAAAVTALAKSLGVKVASGASVAFDPGWLVYIPSPEVRVTAGTLTIGAPAPSPGTVLFETAKTIGAAKIIDSPAVVPDAATSVDTGESSAEDHPAPSREGLVAEPAERLQVGSLQLELDESRSNVSSGGLSELSGITEIGATVIRASLVSPTTRESWQIPSAAVFTSVDRKTCVVLRAGNPLEVRIVAESRGTATVDAKLDLGDRVVVNPLVDDRSCV